MKLPKLDQKGITHMLAPLIFIVVFAIVGSYVLLKGRAQTPTANTSIGDSVSFTPTADQLQTVSDSDQAASASAEADRKACPPAPSETQLKSLNSQVADAINAFRKSKGLTHLNVSLKLNAAARQHSEEMDTKGYFNHPCYDGTAFWKRIQYYYSSKNYSYWTVGENLACEPDMSAADAMKLWIGSPKHLANLKDKDWHDLGVSAIQATDVGGKCGTGATTLITADFGARH